MLQNLFFLFSSVELILHGRDTGFPCFLERANYFRVLFPLFCDSPKEHGNHFSVSKKIPTILIRILIIRLIPVLTLQNKTVALNKINNIELATSKLQRDRLFLTQSRRGPTSDDVRRFISSTFLHPKVLAN